MKKKLIKLLIKLRLTKLAYHISPSLYHRCIYEMFVVTGFLKGYKEGVGESPFKFINRELYMEDLKND